MGTAQIHYEVFRRIGRGTGWSLVEALDERDGATKLAQQILAEGAAAVRVVKETFKPDTGDYLSLVVLEEGKAADKKNRNDKVGDGSNPTPCFKPDDLYSYHARAALSRLIGEWLARNKLTPTELIHSGAALEKFEATGTTYQHAIQKTAVAQASGTDVKVSQIVKQLNDLTTTAIQRVYRDEKRGAFIDCIKGGFGNLASRLAGQPEAQYLLNGSLAKYLAHAKGWDDKLQRLLALMDEMPAEDGPPRALLLGAIDAIISEILAGSAALADLLGHNATLGHALINLIELFLGATVNTPEGAGRGINELSQYFSRDELPAARTAIANRILAELRGPHRLCPASFEDELKMLRRLANELVRGQGKYLSNEELIGAFTERSRRLVHNDALSQFLADCRTPDQRFECLMAVEENIIGAENKRTLAAFIAPLVTSNAFEDQIAAGAPAVLRLRRIAQLQERVVRSGFQDTHKNQIGGALDQVALRIETRAHFLAGLEAKIPNPVERAQALLKLTVNGVFTQGDLVMKARRMLMAALARPGFLANYVAHENTQREVAIANLVGQLEKAGIAAEDSMRTLAA